MSLKIFVSGLILSFITLVPLGIKWELEKKIVVPAATFIGIMSWVIVNGSIDHWNLSFYQILIFQLFMIGILSTSLLLWRFYRDPDRLPPEGENAILSPADGKIIYIKKIENGEIPFSEKNGKKFPLTDFTKSNMLSSRGYIIGISMNFLDVHVNRAPIEGKICLLNHIKGLFISLKSKKALVQNERVLTVIDNGHFKVGIIQIASRLVRKIISFYPEGHNIQRGQRVGAIRFGSQVDVILPELITCKIDVKPGDKVKAGISIIATYKL
ncbi:MAG: phosphatidylserine decarboxylase [Promethearchaeota archaeon]|jgi:phosphatidylserine decarboxylase